MNLIFKHSQKILLFIGIIFLFFAFNISNFTLDASTDSLVLENDKDLLYYQKIREEYPSQDSLIIGYKIKGDLLSTAQLQGLGEFIKQLKNISSINKVTSILSVPLFSSPPLSIVDLSDKNISIENGNANLLMAKQEFKTSPIYSDNLVSLDGQTTAIILNIKTNQDFAKLKAKRNHLRLQSLDKKALQNLEIISKQVAKNVTIADKNIKKTIGQIRNVISNNSDKAQIFLGGLPVISNDIIAYIGGDLVFFSLSVLLVITLILIFIFRSMRFVIMPIGVSIFAALTMTGILGFVGWKATVISSNFFSLLLVMTLSVMIHLIVRYRELSQFNQEFSKQQLIEKTVQQMFKPCLYTTITTLLAFASLLISGIRPVIDFGYMMAIGVSLAFILSFILFPTIMNLLPKISIKIHNTEADTTKFFANITAKFGKWIIYFASIILLISIYGISQISVENRFIDYFKKSTEINRGLSLIDEKLGGTIPLEVIIDDLGEDYWNDPEIRQTIHQVHNYLDNLPATGKVLSVDTLMQLLSHANGGSPPGGFFLSIIRSQIPDSTAEQVLTPYISKDNGSLRFLARIKENTPNLNRKQLLLDIKQYLQNNFNLEKNSVHLTGMMVLYNNMLQSLFNSQIKTIGLVFLLIFIMFLLLFRSFLIAIIAIIPNILPPMLILGIMGIMGIPLDLMTITIAAITIGIGVDNAIHYIQRFKTEFVKDNDYLASMFRAHSSIGLAMFYTSITVALGFIVLIFSNFIPSIYFGLFTAIAMVSAVALNLTLLPRLLIMFRPKIK